LFRDVNLLYNWSKISIGSIEKNRIKPHWPYIRALRIYVDGGSRTVFWESDTNDIARIISTCVNLKSLGLYYADWQTDYKPINIAVMNLLEDHKLDTIGIYGRAVLGDWIFSKPQGGWTVGPMEILHKIAASTKASMALKKLDIVTEWMSKETYALLQSSPFPNLESLTVLSSFRHAELWSHDAAERNKWCPATRLVRLQLINCKTAYSPEIPLMVQQFENLQELLVSASGYNGDIIPPRRRPGWSRETGALCRNRKPLRIFSIEHTSEREILTLGTIPTVTLVSSNVRRENLLRALEVDSELFPGMAVLSVLPDRLVHIGDPDEWGQESEDEETEAVVALIEEKKKRLEAVCSKRRVELRRDAVRMGICYCCSGY
jgi:hypothetical protein